MRKFSKVISLLVILVMITGALTACGSGKGSTTDPTKAPTQAQNNGEDPTEAPTEGETEAPDTGLVPEDGASLLVWESSDASGTFLQEAAKQFEQKYGVPVKYENVETDQATSKIELDGPNGTGADVFAVPHDNLGRLMSAGLVLDNDMPGYTADNYLETALSATSYEGSQIGYPLALDGYAMFYNKDLIDAPPATWDELVEFAAGFNDPSSNKYAIMWDVAGAYFAYTFVGYAGDLFGPNGDDKSVIPFDSADSIAALTYFQELRSKVYNVNATDATFDAGKAGFMEGKAAMIIGGTWNVEEFKNAGLNIGVAEIPAFGDKKSVSFMGVRGLYVNSFTQYPIASKMFADFCANELAPLRYEMTGMISASKKVTDYNDIDQGFLAQFSHAFPMPKIPEMSGYWGPMGTAFANIWDGKDVQTEISAAVTAMKEGIN